MIQSENEIDTLIAVTAIVFALTVNPIPFR